MSKMLLSIKPEYVNRIISGEKKYEFRKFRCRKGIDTIVIYATAPMKRVVGEVALVDIIEGDIDYVWHKTKGFQGILKRDYMKYYEKREVAVAYQLGKVTVYEKPMRLEDFGLHYVPQSFAYIQSGKQKSLSVGDEAGLSTIFLMAKQAMSSPLGAWSWKAVVYPGCS